MNALEKNSYELTLDSYKIKSAVKHELYHIYDLDCELDKLGSKFVMENGVKRTYKYLFLDEPKAVLYASTGIKLPPSRKCVED